MSKSFADGEIDWLSFSPIALSSEVKVETLDHSFLSFMSHLG